MTGKELNLKLKMFIPEISETYYKETSWQDGDETGSHIVYADVFVPYIKEQLIKNNDKMIIKIFDYIEYLLKLNDEYANEVIALSVLESLIFDNETENALYMKYARPKTLDLIKEIVENI